MRCRCPPRPCCRGPSGSECDHARHCGAIDVTGLLTTLRQRHTLILGTVAHALSSPTCQAGAVEIIYTEGHGVGVTSGTTGWYRHTRRLIIIMTSPTSLLRWLVG